MILVKNISVKEVLNTVLISILSVLTIDDANTLGVDVGGA
jgi:hypothetical protein